MSIQPAELLCCLVPVVGIIIGIIIGIISIAVSRRKYTGQIQAARTGSVGPNSLAERKPWLNNGFVAGLVTGFAIGIGFTGPFVSNILWKSLSPSSSGINSGIVLIVGVGLAFLLGHMAKKAIVRRGLDSVGYTGKGIGRVMLAIIGAIVGFFVGAACYTPVFLVVTLLVM